MESWNHGTHSYSLARWGAEDFYIATGAEYTARLFVVTFQAFEHVKTTIGVEDNDVDALDELAVDEAKHYKAKISKWIKSAINAVCDAGFWFTMFIAHKTREPLLHFYRWLCSKHRPGRMMIVELVTRRSSSIQSEFDSLHSKFATWVDQGIKFASGVCDVSKKPLHDDVVKTFRDVAAMLLLHNAACFSRRILQTYQRCLGALWQLCGRCFTQGGAVLQTTCRRSHDIMT